MQRTASTQTSSWWLAPADLMLATVTVGITIIRVLLSRSPKAVESLGLVVLDVSYTLDQVRGRELEAAMTARSCSGLSATCGAFTRWLARMVPRLTQDRSESAS